MGWASRRGRQKDNGGKEAFAGRRVRAKQDLRLSERLVDLIAPYRDAKLPLKAYEKLIAAAALAWNLSLLPEAERPAVMRQAFRGWTGRDLEAAAEVIGGLMRRKQQLFPDDHRTIVSWEVSESDGHCHVSVASLVA